jgi:hypothetical protein
VAAAVCAVAVGSAQAAHPGYDSLRDSLLAQGRAVDALVAAGDADAVVARFTPELAGRVTKADVEHVLAATGHLGVRVGESALPLSPARRVYLADHRSGSRTLALTVLLTGGTRSPASTSARARPCRATRTPATG